MTPADKQRALILKLERKLRQDIYGVKKTFTIVQSKKLWKTKKISKEDGEALYSDILQTLIRHYKRIIPVFSAQIETVLKKSEIPPIEKKRQLYEDLLIFWIENQGFKAAKSISKTTIKDITIAAIDAFEDEQITNEGAFIKKILVSLGVSLFRSTVIARTETHMAAMYASIKAAENMEQTLNITLYKKWNATNDERTRANHAEVDNKKILMNEKFIVGGEKMDRPSDPNASAANVINCRCVLTYERTKT